jgi:hypothetical protein
VNDEVEVFIVTGHLAPLPHSIGVRVSSAYFSLFHCGPSIDLGSAEVEDGVSSETSQDIEQRPSLTDVHAQRILWLRGGGWSSDANLSSAQHAQIFGHDRAFGVIWSTSRPTSKEVRLVEPSKVSVSVHKMDDSLYRSLLSLVPPRGERQATDGMRAWWDLTSRAHAEMVRRAFDQCGLNEDSSVCCHVHARIGKDLSDIAVAHPDSLRPFLHWPVHFGVLCL